MRRDGSLTLTSLSSRLLPLVLGASLLLAACTSASPGPATSQATAPAKPAQATQALAATSASQPAAKSGPECPVLTKQDVESALGRPVLNADILITEGALISCGYRDPNSPARLLGGVMVQSGSQAKLGYQTRKGNADDAKAVAGLGDDAFWSDGDDNLEVLKGGNAIIIGVHDEIGGDRAKIAQTLAEKVLAKLPAVISSSAATKTTAASGQAAALDPCSLLTKEEVAAVIGKTLDPVKTTTSTEYSSCAYEDPAHKPQYLVDVSIMALSPSQAKAAYGDMKGRADEPQDVAGIGEAAFYTKMLGRGNLHMLQGKYYVTLSVDSDATADGLKAAKELAPKVLSRLP